MPRRPQDGPAQLPPTFRPGDREPPNAPEAERGLLGAILLDTMAMASAAEHLKGEDFFHPAHQKIFDAMIRLSDTGIGLDPVTVGNALRDVGELEGVGGHGYLGSLLGEAASSASVEYYAQIVRDKAAVRRMIATAASVVSEGYASELEPREFLDRSEQKMFAAGDARIHGRVRPLGETLDEAVERIEKLRDRKEHVTGVPTHYKRLDTLLSGFQPSDLIIIAARPSMGKTSFALNLALNAVVASDRKSVLFSSLEMSESQLADRLLCLQANIESSRLRAGFVAAGEMDRIRDARDQLRDAPLFIDDTPKMSVLELRAKARRKAHQKQLDLVMVDYLQLIDPADKRVSREQQISEISRSLKAMAKELHVPVIALSQLSRAPETRPGKDKRPLLSDLRESGAIEQDADVVMFLYRPEYYEREEEKKAELRGKLEVIIAKQRNGPTDTVELAFIKETMQVAEPADYGSPH